MIRCEVKELLAVWAKPSARSRMRWRPWRRDPNADPPQDAILNGVEFVVAPATSTAIPIMGPSGHGKSTLLYHMAGLKWPLRGEVRWSFTGHKPVFWTHEGLPSAEAEALRRRFFGFMFQDATLSEFLTVEDNLVYPLRMRNWSADHIRERIEELATRFFNGRDRVLRRKDDWAKIRHQYPTHLSGGERQRVSLIQALAHRPVVLFADEPTGNLDIQTRETVMSVLDEWLAGADRAPSAVTRQQRILLWVTHHETDPQRMGSAKRIHVENGSVEWRTE